MPKPATPIDPRFAPLEGLFADGPQLLTSDIHQEEDRIQAAVSLILRSGPDLDVLLIRRSKSERDPWSGHMALPGGRREDVDGDLRATAMRETLEETGVCLDTRGTLLGRMPPLIPSTPRLPPISIFPFIFAVDEGTTAEVASHEVAEVLWAPLSQLQSPDSAGTVEIPLGDVRRPFPCIRYDERVIWGLTYRILTDFFRRLKTGAPDFLASE